MRDIFSGSPSSRGLGHRLLTAETGVRLPLGIPKIDYILQEMLPCLTIVVKLQYENKGGIPCRLMQEKSLWKENTKKYNIKSKKKTLVHTPTTLFCKV